MAFTLSDNNSVGSLPNPLVATNNATLSDIPASFNIFKVFFHRMGAYIVCISAGFLVVSLIILAHKRILQEV